MQIHIGFDDMLELIHSVNTTAAKVHSIVPTDKLLPGEEQRIFGGADYFEIKKRGKHQHRKNMS